LVTDEQIDFIKSHLDMLTPKESAVFKLSMLGYVPNQIADILEMKKGNVNSHLYNARQKYRKINFN